VLLDSIDPLLHARSGETFYTGRAAFEQSTPLYLLGLNPGGGSQAHLAHTIGYDIELLRQRDEWSSYSDEAWADYELGQHPYQRSVLHLLAACELNPRLVPASNVIFARTRTESEIGVEKQYLLKACWPVHERVIRTLGVGVIVCCGGTAGEWVRAQLGAHQEVDMYVETNGRGWDSQTHEGRDGIQVVTLTHPSRADWTNPAADPTSLVLRALARRQVVS